MAKAVSRIGMPRATRMTRREPMMHPLFEHIKETQATKKPKR
jgi:hypothetical protein